MKWTSRTGSQCGLTLVELMVTLLILAAVATLGAPSLSSSLARHRQRTAVQSLFAAFQFARVEAVTRQRAVTLCPAAQGVNPCGGDYAAGWNVFVAADPRTGQERQLIRQFAPLAAGLQVRNRAGTRLVADPVTWYPDGTARRNLTLQVCSKQGGPAQVLGVVLNGVGRARVARGEGSCPGEAT